MTLVLAIAESSSFGLHRMLDSIGKDQTPPAAFAAAPTASTVASSELPTQDYHLPSGFFGAFGVTPAELSLASLPFDGSFIRTVVESGACHRYERVHVESTQVLSFCVRNVDNISSRTQAMTEILREHGRSVCCKWYQCQRQQQQRPHAVSRVSIPGCQQTVRIVLGGTPR